MEEMSFFSVSDENPEERSYELIEDWSKYLRECRKQFQEKCLIEPAPTKSLNDFHVINTVGFGTFGTVVLAKGEFNDEYYAIKILEKARIIKLNQVNQTLSEKRLLFGLHFPFIVHMEFFFKDNSYIYFVLPFINGGEIFSYLRNKGNFSEYWSTFYASQIVLALEYLHNLDIIYRDLKPENVLIAYTGYIKITDLGFAKVVATRTYTFCGTPDYLAPEVILSKGYSHSVDWWALGVFIYEMVAGHPPFYASEPMKKYELIAACKYVMVPSFSVDLKDLIFKLLQVDISKRIGALKGGVNDIKKHQWFRKIEWLDIVNMKVKPPFIPKVDGPGDSSNFDKVYHTPFRIASVELFKDEFKDF